jgi:uroporphyrinogen-III synthase
MDMRLDGMRVGLLEARMSNELADLIRRYGGDPYCVPAVRESPLECADQVGAFISSLSEGSLQVIIFLTGVGARTLFQEAEKLGRWPELFEGLERVTTVCRGPKPVAVLKRTGVHISIVAPEPNTTVELLEAIASLDIRGKGVGLTHYGERNVLLTDALEARGAKLFEMCLYEWQLPEDVQALRNLVAELIGGSLGAVAFTSQIQIRHLFQMAEESGRSRELAEALNTRLIVASVGPTCTGVLQAFGVTPHVVPEHPKMGHLVMSLAQYVHAKNNRV